MAAIDCGRRVPCARARSAVRKMYLDGDTFRDALQQVLALPPEERLNQVANVFARVAEDTWARSGEEEEP
jgi:hypothetical protein